jgi:hypothetical protein
MTFCRQDGFTLALDISRPNTEFAIRTAFGFLSLLGCQLGKP